MYCCTSHFWLEIHPTDSNDKAEYPMDVYAPDGETLIGVANTATEYADLWNAYNDASTNPIGHIYPSTAAYSVVFLFIATRPISNPPTLWGASLYAIVDTDGIAIQDGRDNYLIYQP